MKRIRLHNLTIRVMGLAVFLFITGNVMSRGGGRGGLGVTLGSIGSLLFVIAIVYGLASTFLNLRCPSCKASFGAVVSSLMRHSVSGTTSRRRAGAAARTCCRPASARARAALFETC